MVSWVLLWLLALTFGLVWFIARSLLIFAGGIAPGAPPPAFVQWFFEPPLSLIDWILLRLSN